MTIVVKLRKTLQIVNEHLMEFTKDHFAKDTLAEINWDVQELCEIIKELHLNKLEADFTFYTKKFIKIRSYENPKIPF